MYISPRNKAKGKKKGDKVSFWVGLLATFPLSFILSPNAQEPIAVAITFTLFFGWILGLLFRAVFGFIFVNHYQKKYQRETNEWKKTQSKIHRRRERQQYKENLHRDLERKRAELRIELEHFKQIAMIQAHQDENKMRYLAKMERQLESDQQSDLDKLDQQIKRMKQGL